MWLSSVPHRVVTNLQIGGLFNEAYTNRSNEHPKCMPWLENNWFLVGEMEYIS